MQSTHLVYYPSAFCGVLESVHFMKVSHQYTPTCHVRIKVKVRATGLKCNIILIIHKTHIRNGYDYLYTIPCYHSGECCLWEPVSICLCKTQNVHMDLGV